MKAIYEVQTVNRNTGAEHWVRVEADNAEAARSKVIGLGEVVGEVRLAEVLESPAPAPTPFIPGVVTCPRCTGQVWDGGRGCLVWLGVILLFPIGLLLLFVKPTWRCVKCRYTFQSYTAPVNPGELPHQHGVLYQIVYAILVVVAILGGLLVLALLFGQ